MFHVFSTCLAKEALCVIASQAYAELNRWQEVVPFITQPYDGIEDCPPKVVQLGLVYKILFVND